MKKRKTKPMTHGMAEMGPSSVAMPGRAGMAMPMMKGKKKTMRKKGKM